MRPPPSSRSSAPRAQPWQCDDGHDADANPKDANESIEPKTNTLSTEWDEGLEMRAHVDEVEEA
eukprot:782012-Alexandrium_andersonii.AAC.1